MILVGWSLGGIYRPRVVAKDRPDLVEKVVTLGSPFSGDRRRNNNVWRLYELVAGHPVERAADRQGPRGEAAGADACHLVAPRRHRLVRPARAAKPGERDAELELDCSHMGFGVSGRAYPKIVEAMREFGPSTPRSS